MATDSPLTRQVQETFEPKVVQLYSRLFNVNAHDGDEDALPSEGFWREFFLLNPDKQKFNDVLEPLTAEDLLHIHTQTRSFFRRAIAEAGSGLSPQNENALENLTGFLAAVLSKRYTNPSTDIIEVLAGLDAVDKTVSNLVGGLESIIRQSENASFRKKATTTSLVTVAGSYQTSLVTYFIHKDMFPALMKYARDATEPVPEALSLLGLLGNYNKFESQNLYQNRMEDFVNEETINKLIMSFATICSDIRNKYTSIQDDAAVPWSVGSALTYVGLRSLSPDAKKPPPPTEDEAKALFNVLPPPEASVILATYSFTQANNLFASNLISSKASANTAEPPLSVFLSSTSYLCHHAHRNQRVLHYSILSLLTIRLLLEDSILFKRISSASDNSVSVRLARQRPPHLPLVTSPRPPTTIILDILTDTLSHNLRKRISLPLYSLTLTILHTTLTSLSLTKSRLPHAHWSYIWGSLLSLLRFLTTYATDLCSIYRLSDLQAQLCTPLTSILAFSLSRGDNFLPDPASYDDLFYKLIEATDVLGKFHDAFCKSSPPPTSSSSSSSSSSSRLVRATNALIAITTHYQTLLAHKSAKKVHQSPKEIQKIIKEGYETMPEVGGPAIATAADGSVVGSGTPVGAAAAAGPGSGVVVDDFAQLDKWREISWKPEIKKILRTVVEDGRALALQSKDGPVTTT